MGLVVCCLSFGSCNMVRVLPRLWVSGVGILRCFLVDLVVVVLFAGWVWDLWWFIGWCGGYVSWG